MNHILLVFLWFCVVLQETINCSPRVKRTLIFPPTTPTRVQIISGIGVPVNLEPPESVVIGYVLKAEYWLPETADGYLSLINDPFDVRPQLIAGERKRREINQTNGIGFDDETKQKFERFQVNAELIESSSDETIDDEEKPYDDFVYHDGSMGRNVPRKLKRPQDFTISRWSLYKTLEVLAKSKGIDGKACILRGICESAHASFDYENGILGELMHIVMTPSTSKDQIRDPKHLEYLKAEEMGRRGEPCEQVFRDCRLSILSQISKVYLPFVNLIDHLI